MSQKFGDIIREKRKEQGYTLRTFSSLIEYSPGFWSDVENGRRKPPAISKLDEIVSLLKMSSAEAEALYDAAGDDSGNNLPPDLSDMIQDAQVRRALRVAREKAAKSDWAKFIEGLERK